MNNSLIGMRWAQKASIVSLMEDLGKALYENPDMIFMGGGNPGSIPEVQDIFRMQLSAISKDKEKANLLLGNYQSPQGDLTFRCALADYFSVTNGWDIDESNIVITGGSQSAFFVLYNMFAGKMPDGSYKTIHLPLSPEYVGYREIGLEDGLFSATRPIIEHIDTHRFKYHIDFTEVEKAENIGALSFSRPTNPTGNVITDEEINRLDALAKSKGVPLIIDGAYGLPFPNILFERAKPFWNDRTILALSLSKLGLPGVRCGAVIANSDIIDVVKNANTVLNLASSNLGPALMTPMLADHQLDALTESHIKPFYKKKADFACAMFDKALQGLSYAIHKPEGAMFVWIWFDGLPITAHELYARLKGRGVLIMPGEDFFIGIDTEWKHSKECIRVSYAQDESTIEKGVLLIAEEVKRAYAIK